MALTRLNNRSVSAVTALPNGIDIPVGVIQKNDLPSNSIIQIRNATYSTNTTISSSSMITIATVQITVLQGSSVYISATIPWFSDQGSSWNNCPSTTIYRNDTTVVQTLEHQGIFNASGASSQQLSAISLDSSLNAGTYTYTLKINHVLGNTGGTVNRSPRYTQLTAMEIAA